MRSLMMAPVLSLCALLVAAPVSALTTGSILAQHSNGDVYAVDVSNAQATLFRDLNDVAPFSGTNEENSPNALGNGNGTMFRADFVATDNNRLYRDNENFLHLPDSGLSVASGDVFGDKYYYVDGNANLRVVSNIFGAAGDTTVANLGNLFSPQALGDLVVTSNSLIISAGTTLYNFAFDGVTIGASTSRNLSQIVGDRPANSRFAGLAFAGDTLFGFDATGTSNTLFQISTALGTFGDLTKIGLITGGPSTGQFTDAAVVPLPAAAWFLISAIGGFALFKRRRSLA